MSQTMSVDCRKKIPELVDCDKKRNYKILQSVMKTRRIHRPVTPQFSPISCKKKQKLPIDKRKI